MYKYKVNLIGLLGYKLIVFTNANSSLEAQSNALAYANDPNLRVSNVECMDQVLTVPTIIPSVVSIHNVIPVDFRTKRRVTT